MNIANNYLTPAEKKDLQVWSEKNDQSDVAIWSVFWGNLLTNRHLIKEEDVKKIVELVGLDRFHQIDESTFFFTLPKLNMNYNAKNGSLRAGIADLLNHLA